jgi:hypothetical protein
MKKLVIFCLLIVFMSNSVYSDVRQTVLSIKSKYESVERSIETWSGDFSATDVTRQSSHSDVKQDHLPLTAENANREAKRLKEMGLSTSEIKREMHEQNVRRSRQSALKYVPVQGHFDWDRRRAICLTKSKSVKPNGELFDVLNLLSDEFRVEFVPSIKKPAMDGFPIVRLPREGSSVAEKTELGTPGPFACFQPTYLLGYGGAGLSDYLQMGLVGSTVDTKISETGVDIEFVNRDLTSDVSKIVMSFEVGDSFAIPKEALRVDRSGNVVAKCEWDWQTIDGIRIPVKVVFRHEAIHHSFVVSNCVINQPISQETLQVEHMGFANLDRLVDRVKNKLYVYWNGEFIEASNFEKAHVWWRIPLFFLVLTGVGVLVGFFIRRKKQ